MRSFSTFPAVGRPIVQYATAHSEWPTATARGEGGTQFPRPVRSRRPCPSVSSPQDAQLPRPTLRRIRGASVRAHPESPKGPKGPEGANIHPFTRSPLPPSRTTSRGLQPPSPAPAPTRRAPRAPRPPVTQALRGGPAPDRSLAAAGRREGEECGRKEGWEPPRTPLPPRLPW